MFWVLPPFASGGRIAVQGAAVRADVWAMLVVLACAPSPPPPAMSVGASPLVDSVVVAVGPSGGAVDLPGVARVVFPPGAFPSKQDVTLLTTSGPSTPSGRTDWDVSVGGPSVPLAYDIRVRTGDQPPTTPFDIAIVIPADYLRSIPPSHRPALFAHFMEGGGSEALEILRKVASTIDATGDTLRAEVPLAAVLPPSPPDTRYETILVVGSVPP